MTDRLGVYIHIPFCRSKCHYCDFCSRSGQSDEVMRLYTDALCNEIRSFRTAMGQRCTADTVYFGGGTPTLLPADCFESIIECLHECFCIVSDAEITVEANPKTADREKLSALRGFGVSRLSVGMQSVHDSELKALGRIHSFADFLGFYSDARSVGFDNISVDLMYGIPEQTAESFEESLRTVCALSPEHISSYCLKIEQGTRFYKRRDELSLPDEDTVADMYLKMTDILRGVGYGKYEISNFALPDRYSRHNLKYWVYDDYIGFGSAAHSFVSGARFCNSRDIEKYISSGGMGVHEEYEEISRREAENEFVMLGMRLADGVDIEKYQRLFGKDFFDDFGVGLKKFSPEFVTVEGGRCAFTDKGMLVSNTILSEILEF